MWYDCMPFHHFKSYTTCITQDTKNFAVGIIIGNYLVFIWSEKYQSCHRINIKRKKVYVFIFKSIYKIRYHIFMRNWIFMNVLFIFHQKNELCCSTIVVIFFHLYCCREYYVLQEQFHLMLNIYCSLRRWRTYTYFLHFSVYDIVIWKKRIGFHKFSSKLKQKHWTTNIYIYIWIYSMMV